MIQKYHNNSIDKKSKITIIKIQVFYLQYFCTMGNFNSTTVEIFNKLEQPSNIKNGTLTALVVAQVLDQKDGKTRVESFMKTNSKNIYEMISEAKNGINLINIEIPDSCPIKSAEEFCYYMIMRKTNLIQSDKQELNQDIINKYKPIIDLNYGPEGAVYLWGEGKKVIDAALQSFNTMQHEEIVKILWNMTDINAAEILILMENEKIAKILSDIKDNKFTGILSRLRWSGSVDNERYGKILEAMSDDMLLNKIFLPTISDQSSIYYDLLEILNLMSKKKALRILENLSDEIVAEILASNWDEYEAELYYNKMPKERAANIASIIKYPIISRL
jgi:flagellar motility protein MotE (MotC chaperone)